MMNNNISTLDIANIILRYTEMDVYSSFLIARKIKKILEVNKDIKEIRRHFPNFKKELFDDLEILINGQIN
jgi:hypothetical protein